MNLPQTTNNGTIFPCYQQQTGEVCMKGSIYTDEKCPVCGGVFRNDENRNGLFCSGKIAPHKEVAWLGKCRVYFQKTSSRFGSYKEAQQFLLYLRVKYRMVNYEQIKRVVECGNLGYGFDSRRLHHFFPKKSISYKIIDGIIFLPISCQGISTL